ncbi:leucine--tRNA ligase [Halorientalis marina]|uniref:leucine--tRNA ligase n=1 Tax=Halorientalis marina TaxID=2931976 RepID=UPI001FF1E1EC|nr:leucine--tRNA ligase [Halorientalis marina]
MDYEPQELEAEWRQRWAEAGQYEADPSAGDKDPTFITVPYPYPSGGMHIGHCRTYTVPDVYARYRRLQGDNVLFPIAWHVTGTPIVGAVERLKKGKEDQLSVLQDTYNVPQDTLEDLETPMGYARYFIENHYKQGMKQLGLSIDWRREFTTNDERYSKFITWQYRTLKERGLLEKGLHPVKFCTNEQNPVTTHDLLEGEEAEFQDYTLVKFEAEVDGQSVVAPMATLRPETVRGVTNAYVHPDGEYVRASVDSEEWVVSTEAVEKLRLQEREIEIHAELSGEDLIGETVTNPITGDEVVILPAEFVDTDNATGVVMSVPAHSPDDYMALQEVKERADDLAEYGIDPDDVRAIEPIPILDIEGYGEVPAADAVAAAGIESSDDPELEDVTADLYQDEFHSGVMHDDYGEFGGKTVQEIREEFRDHYRDEGAFDEMYEFTEEVVCRCGGAVEVAKQDTWFLRYNDDDWQAKAHRAVENLTAIPENTREQYDHTIDWLEEWPCIRNYGLGTRLPWDEDFVIEPLSDSTIYMAYYTIAHRIDDVPVEDLTPEFFDALFYGADAVDGEAPEQALELREEWDHWYPVDFRCSANDLIQNHLTFFLYHHAELFDPDNWPEGITIMGMGLLEGEKMSSSKGHVVLPSKAIDEYGADTVRFFLLNSAEPWQDYDWRDDLVGSTRDQLDRFWNRSQEVIDFEAPDERPALEHVDRWLLAKLQGTIETATAAMERFETRTASQTVFYNFEEHLKWYRRRADLSRDGAKWTLQAVLRARLRLLAPFVPFMANELHEQLTGEPAEDADWPEVDPEWEDERTEIEESLIERLTDDVNDIVDVTGTDPDRIRVYVAADWKRDVFEQVRERAERSSADGASGESREQGLDVGAVMGQVMEDPDLREKGDAVNDLVQDLVEVGRERDEATLAAMSEVDEVSVYEAAVDFLEREFEADVSVIAEDADDIADPDDTAGDAVPFRPAIHLA